MTSHACNGFSLCSLECRLFTFASTAAMMKAVGSALNTTYSGKKWLRWFTKTAKAMIAELDGKSATDGVGTCTVS